jgi:hypothetical protein
MADRIITFIIPKKTGDGTRQGGTFYIEEDYEPIAVRVYSRIAPSLGDLEVDIKADGVSIFKETVTTSETPKTTPSEISYGTHSATVFTVNESISGTTSGAIGLIESLSLGHLNLRLIGTTAFTAGETITGASSGATATVDSFVRGGINVVFKSTTETGVILAQGDNSEEDITDFADEILNAGSWVSCDIGETGGAKDITVSLELARMDNDKVRHGYEYE